MRDLPVFAQGVFLPSLTQFAGDAIVSRRSTAEWRSVTILFKPATMITCFGPNIMAATRLPVPSTLYNSPYSVIALVLAK